MEITIDANGIRRRHVIDGKGKKRSYKLCTDQENTCMNDGRENGTCAGCKAGAHRYAIERQEGDLFTEDGIRFIFTGGQRKKLCVGKDNTCSKLARADAQCTGCTTSRERLPIKDRVRGEIIINNGQRLKFDGREFRKPCTGDDDTCTKYAITNGQCKIHANGGARKERVKK